MSTLEEIQKRVDDLDRQWAADDSAQTEAVRAPYEPKPIQLPEMDLSEHPTQLPEMDLSPGGADAAAEAPSVKPPEAPKPPTEPWARIKYDLEANAKRPPQADGLAEKMKAAGWGPKASPPAPDWEALQRNVQNAERQAGVDRSVNQAFATVSPNQHFHADPNAGQAEVEAAKTPLELAQARQKFEAEQAAHEQSARTNLLAQTKEMARRDPNSPESQRARAALEPVFKLAGGVPQGFEGWNAGDVEEHARLLTPIAKDVSEGARSDAKAKEAADAKSSSLADRKRLMTSQYVDDPASTLSDDEKKSLRTQIGGLSDLGDAQTFQTALEGRLGRASTQTHADEAQKSTQQHADTAAALTRAHEDAMLSRREAFEKAMKEDARTNAPLTTEQKQALEGFASVPGVLKILDSSTADTNSFMGRIGAQFPTIAGAANLPGATFKSSTEAAASVLARIVDGGTARPGTIEILQQILPKSTDSVETKALRRQQLQDYIEAKHQGVLEGIRQSGAKLPVPAAPISAAPTERKTPGGKPYARKQVNDSGAVRYLDAQGNVVQ